MIKKNFMKALLVIYRDNERAGGSVRVAEVLANSLLRLGVDLYVIVAYGGKGRLAKTLGDRCLLMHAADKFDFHAWWRYRRLLKELNPDLVHYIDTVGWMTLAGAGLHSTRIMHQHFRPDVGPDGSKRFKAIRWLSGTADQVIAISVGAGRQLTEKCGIPSTKVSVVHNAIDPTYLISDTISEDAIVTKYPRERVLGMAVRVVEDKGIEDAFYLLRKLPSNYILAIAGDGPAKARLENLAVEMGLAARTRWLGSVSDIRNFYAGIDYYLFMSWYEGFGLSVAEAMFLRKPVVGLLGDGEIAEAEYPLVNSENSLLFGRTTPGAFKSESDPEVIRLLAEAILDLDIDRDTQKKYVENAYDWVHQRFTSEVQAERILAVYSKTLSRKKSWQQR